MGKPVTWVVVADAARSRVFETTDNGKSLAAVLDQDLVTDHRPSHDIDADRPGRTFDSDGAGRHAKEPKTDPHRHAKQVFAHEIARLLKHEKDTAGRYDQLVIVAPPSFLGDLRDCLSPTVKSCVTHEIAKDLTKLPERELAATIHGHLWQ
ncbi:MAG: host attachment protein [Alphaproteobacteria bacterium]|nr:host attachment protein [Alphaproteobacteria bacterium]